MLPDRVGIERLPSGKLNTPTGMTAGPGLCAARLSGNAHPLHGLEWRVGLSPIRQAMNALGVASAAEEFGARYFGNGSRPSIILKHLAASRRTHTEKRLRESFSENWEGLENAPPDQHPRRVFRRRWWVFRQEEAQFLQARQYQVQEIARLYGVPLHMLAVGGRPPTPAQSKEAINFRQLTMLLGQPR